MYVRCLYYSPPLCPALSPDNNRLVVEIFPSPRVCRVMLRLVMQSLVFFIVETFKRLHGLQRETN